jgi:hypothetical protein
MRSARLISLVGVLALIEILANIVSNPAADELAHSVPLTLATTLLALSLLVIVGDTWLLSRLESGRAAEEPRLRYSRAYQLGAFLLVALGALLAVCVGVLTNLVAARYPADWKPYALAILMGLAVGGVAFVWRVYREEHSPSVHETNRVNFRERQA